MVIEGILTTENADGSMHVAPIGPHVNAELTSWTLKPFQTSNTFVNLRATNRAVFHVVDDSLLMAAAVLGICNRTEGAVCESTFLSDAELDELVESQFHGAMGWVLTLCCSYFALSVKEWDVSDPRAIAQCTLADQRQRRPFWGWNRARHSILELAVLASRIHMLDRATIDEELGRHKIIIEKTAGSREIAAWELLRKRLSQ